MKTSASLFDVDTSVAETDPLRLRVPGHEPAQAAEILLDAKRKDDHARAWIKAVLAYERSDINS
jgi:hypothetical protein